MTLGPSQNVLFAAGEDNVVRAWRTRDGEQLHPPGDIDLPDTNIIGRQFDKPIVGLHFSDIVEGDKNKTGPAMWVATGEVVQSWSLGKQRAKPMNSGIYVP